MVSVLSLFLQQSDDSLEKVIKDTESLFKSREKEYQETIDQIEVGKEQYLSGLEARETQVAFILSNIKLANWHTYYHWHSPMQMSWLRKARWQWQKEK